MWPSALHLLHSSRKVTRGVFLIFSSQFRKKKTTKKPHFSSFLVSLQDPLEFTVGICTSGCPRIQFPPVLRGSFKHPLVGAAVPGGAGPSGGDFWSTAALPWRKKPFVLLCH